jgi:hypothetical protein
MINHFLVIFLDFQEFHLLIGVGDLYLLIFDNDGWKDLFISNGTRREVNNKDYFQ